ncbi:hypothetical protein ACEPPN_016286 [Leptodophora sp. 'Broadleaf-Isolate-01']
MGGKKNRRRQVSADWYASGTEESDTNATGNHKISELSTTYVVGERANGNGNGQTDTRNDTRRYREGKRANQPRLNYESTLGPWTQAVDEAIKGMGAVQRALGVIEETKRRLDQAKEEGKKKDEELRRHENTIRTLTSIDHKSRADVKSQLTQIDAERPTTEEKLRLNRNFEERIFKQDKSHKARIKELQNEFAQKSQENSKKAAALEAE